MRERPILFSAPMVRAILAGTKTQTRRIYKNRKHPDFGCDIAGCELSREKQHVIDRACPYGQPGDRLWVRETFNLMAVRVNGEEFNPENYRATRTLPDPVLGWRPSIHMPRWASRILLEITAVRVERLNDISEADAMAEGINCYQFRPDDGFPLCDGYTHESDDGKCVLHESAVAAYIRLWEQINGPGSWAANPWVWVVEFKRTR